MNLPASRDGGLGMWISGDYRNLSGEGEDWWTGTGG